MVSDQDTQRFTPSFINHCAEANNKTHPELTLAVLCDFF